MANNPAWCVPTVEISVQARAKPCERPENTKPTTVMATNKNVARATCWGVVVVDRCSAYSRFNNASIAASSSSIAKGLIRMLDAPMACAVAMWLSGSALPSPDMAITPRSG